MVDRYDEQLLLGYVEGDLTPEQAAAFEKLLEQDPRLRTLAAQMQGDRAGLRRVVPEGAPQDIMESVQARLERGMLLESGPQANGKSATPVHLKWMPYLAYSGVAAMLVLAAGLMLRTLTDSEVLKQASGPKTARQGAGKSTEPLVENPAKLDLADRLRLADAKQKRDNVLSSQDSPGVASNAVPASPMDAAMAARGGGGSGEKTESTAGLSKDLNARKAISESGHDQLAREEARTLMGPSAAASGSTASVAESAAPSAPAASLAMSTPTAPAPTAPAAAPAVMASKENDGANSPANIAAREKALARSRAMSEALGARRASTPAAGPAESEGASARADDARSPETTAALNGSVANNVKGNLNQAQVEFTRTDLKIITADLNRTLQDLDQWAQQQQVQVLELDLSLLARADEQQQQQLQQQAQALGTEKRFVLLMRASQVARLEVHLSGLPNQITRPALANADAPERRAGISGLQAIDKSARAQSNQVIGAANDDADKSASTPAPGSNTGSNAGSNAAPAARAATAAQVPAPASKSDPLVLQPVVIEEIKP